MDSLLDCFLVTPDIPTQCHTSEICVIVSYSTIGHEQIRCMEGHLGTR